MPEHESTFVPAHLALGRYLAGQSRPIAEAAASRLALQFPASMARFGPDGREECVREAEHHLAYLGEAALSDRPAIFAEYVEWARVMLAARDVPTIDLASSLSCLRDAIHEALPDAEVACAARLIDHAQYQLTCPAATSLRSHVVPEQPFGSLTQLFVDLLLAGDRHNASRLILDAVDSGTSVRDVYLHVFQRSQQEIGRLWQLNRVTVAQEHYCSAATQLIMSQLYSRIFNSDRVGRTMVAASVGGDLHEIGIRMVSDFFEIEGWDTFYMGASTPTSTLLETVRTRKPDVVAISATMPYHISAATQLVAALRAARLDSIPRIIVGGRPFLMNEGLWQEVGADASARDAADAVRVAAGLLENAA